MSAVKQFFSVRASFFYGGRLFAGPLTIGGVPWTPPPSTPGAGDVPVLVTAIHPDAPVGRVITGTSYGVTVADSGAGAFLDLGTDQSLRWGSGTHGGTDTYSLSYGLIGTTSGDVTNSVVALNAGGASSTVDDSFVHTAASAASGAVEDSILLGRDMGLAAVTRSIAMGHTMTAISASGLTECFLLGSQIRYGGGPTGQTLVSGGQGSVDAALSYGAQGSGFTYLDAADDDGVHLVGRPNVFIASQSTGDTEFLRRPRCSVATYPSTLAAHLVSKAEIDALSTPLVGSLALPFVLASADPDAPDGRVLTAGSNLSVVDGGAGAPIQVLLNPFVSLGSSTLTGTNTAGLVSMATSSITGDISNSMLVGRDGGSSGLIADSLIWTVSTIRTDAVDSVLFTISANLGPCTEVVAIGRLLVSDGAAAISNAVLLGSGIRHGAGISGHSVFISGGKGVVDASSPYYNADDDFTYFTSAMDTGVQIVGRPSVTIANADGETRFNRRPRCNAGTYVSSLPGHLVSFSELTAAAGGSAQERLFAALQAPPSTFAIDNGRQYSLAIAKSGHFSRTPGVTLDDQMYLSAAPALSGTWFKIKLQGTVLYEDFPIVPPTKIEAIETRVVIVACDGGILAIRRYSNYSPSFRDQIMSFNFLEYLRIADTPGYLRVQFSPKLPLGSTEIRITSAQFSLSVETAR